VKKAIIWVFSAILCASFAVAASAPDKSKNLMINGNCNDPENPLKYWTVEYPNNQNYINNLKYLKLLPEFGGKKNVLHFRTTDDPGYGGFPQYWAGTQAESPMIPFEAGCRYKWSFSVIAGAVYHIYPIGYMFKPGIKPYEHPNLDDLRMKAKGGWAEQVPKKDKWTTVTYEWPEKQLSENGMVQMKAVQFMSLHIINITQIGDVYITDLAVEKLPGGYTGGKITADDKKAPTPPGRTGTTTSKSGTSTRTGKPGK
jgi:hypothetical protein